LIFANLVALTHGFSGILLVLAVKFLFQTQISGSLETVTYITQIISFSLISLLGFMISIKNIYKWIKKPAKFQHRYFTNPYVTAVAVGCIPCPGVVMVMLFAISLNLTWLGILLGAFISIGMAFTVSCIVFLGIVGKTVVLSGAPKHKKVFFVIETIVETSAGLILMGLGIFFLTLI
jgi:ABC-type nickel/cobalt efflux system permease component RcnA